MAILGLDCKLYHGTAGSTASTEATNVKDVKLSLSAGSSDITTRSSNGWRVKAATLKEASLTFKVLYLSSDPFFTALKTAYLGNSALAIKVGDDTGAGLDADWNVTQFDLDQTLEEGVWIDCTCEPTILSTGGRAPSWASGSSSSTGTT